MITKDVKNDSRIQKESGGFMGDRALHSGRSSIRGRHQYHVTFLFKPICSELPPECKQSENMAGHEEECMN